MRERLSTIVLQGAQHRISIDLVTWAVQKTAAIIATDVVAMTDKATAIIKDVDARGACFQDRGPKLERAGYVESAAGLASRVIAEGGVSDVTTASNPAPVVSAISGDGTVGAQLNSLGVDVTLVDGRDKLLPFLDTEISERLRDRFE